MSGEPPYKWGMGNPLGTNTIDDGWSQYREQPAFKLKNDSPDQRELYASERIERLRAALERIAHESYEAKWELKDIARDALDADDAAEKSEHSG